MTTSFVDIYNKFLNKITDDMYFSETYTEEDTKADLKSLLLDAIPNFEFPRFKLFDYDEELEEYNEKLTAEEINILATLMVISWFGRQEASVDQTRMLYTGPDFAASSQANQLDKIVKTRQTWEKRNIHIQRMYKRRKSTENGEIRSNMTSIMAASTFDD